MRKKSDDHFIIVGLREQGNSYKQIAEKTDFKIDKVKYHLKTKNRQKK